MPVPSRLLAGLASWRRGLLDQGEVIATLSLAWVLRDSSAAEAFGQLLGLQEVLTWDPEVFAGADGRPDLVAHNVTDGVPRPCFVVEAKIHHTITYEGQLRPYAEWVRSQRLPDESPTPVVAILVPRSRSVEAARVIAVAPSGECAMVTWEDVFDSFSALHLDDGVRGDLDQLIDFYRQVEASWVAPFDESQAQFGDPARTADFVKLAEQVSTLLHDRIIRAVRSGVRSLPMQRSRYRYVSMRPGEPTATHLAIGVFDEVEKENLPLAVRWHKTTSGFAEVTARLEASGITLQRHQGHVYVPLQVPPDSSHPEMVNALFSQVEDLVHVAAPELRPLAFTADDARAYLHKVRWQFAKTMPQWPHEYTVREWQQDLEREFFEFVALIRRDGTVKPWPRDAATPRYHHTYLELEGWEYWSMGDPIARDHRDQPGPRHATSPHR